MMNTKIKGQIGGVMYSVYVDCPHCGATMDLNDYPYSDDSSEYAHAEDVLGMALFGSKTQPAQWENLEIEYKCCNCDGDFVLSGIEC
jgi:hypothetical protein